MSIELVSFGNLIVYYLKLGSGQDLFSMCMYICVGLGESVGLGDRIGM